MLLRASFSSVIIFSNNELKFMIGLFESQSYKQTFIKI